MEIQTFITTVSAIQLTDENALDIVQWSNGRLDCKINDDNEKVIFVPRNYSSGNSKQTEIGDWIIRDITDRFDALKPELFHCIYTNLDFLSKIIQKIN